MDDFALLAQELAAKLPELELRENEPMKNHCSFRIGGDAAAMALPSSINETEKLCLFLREKGIKPFIIGNGTNLLVTDAPLRRFVIKMSDGMSAVERCGETGVYALSGVSLAKLASECAHFSLTGLEFAHGIPGTLGGAASMNAGAYGGEMKQVVRAVTYLDENLLLREKPIDELDFTYRRTAFSDTDNVVLSCLLWLEKGNEEEILSSMRELSEKRRSSQPLDKPSAGSTFKRPENGYAAALIEESGLKGFAIGGAQVSEKHAGFVINRGGATFDDVIKLMEHIKETVYRRLGIMLEPEVKIIENV
ncbi:MAG: UDP-N-acetylenolpyruvoylglucosamine reductase [Firmicutes bacterium HGW-Firmicutes-16]|nr:MAG: UDP-N-acetylenolpyruvoylglucosamine reductase [Firmicutes bacterium HGW-Firmicutes-16]